VIGQEAVILHGVAVRVHCNMTPTMWPSDEMNRFTLTVYLMLCLSISVGCGYANIGITMSKEGGSVHLEDADKHCFGFI